MKAGAIRGGRAAQAAAAWRAKVARLLRRIGAAIVLLLLAAGLGLWWAARWTPDRALYPTQGVTIDAGNGDVQWGSIKAAGAEFAYIAATDGSGAIDPKFARNMAGARASAGRGSGRHSRARPRREAYRRGAAHDG